MPNNTEILLWGLEKSAALNFPKGLMGAKNSFMGIVPHAHAATAAASKWIEQAPGFMHNATPGAIAAEIGAMTLARALGPKIMGGIKRAVT
jgi:hypothetical protein